MKIYVIEYWTGNRWEIEGNAFRNFRDACDYIQEFPRRRKVLVFLKEKLDN